MKSLNLKSILFGLMATTLTTVFLTSCEKEVITPMENETPFKEQLVIDDQLEISKEIEQTLSSRTFNKTCFVELCYSSYLGRCGEQNGIHYWLGVLGNASINEIATVAKGFITSQEAKNKWENAYSNFLAANGLNRSQIKKSIYIAYRGLLLRQPDVGGGIHWTNIQNNQGLKTAIKGIASSPEFFNRLTTINVECNAYAANCH